MLISLNNHELADVFLKVPNKSSGSLVYIFCNPTPSLIFISAPNFALIISKYINKSLERATKFTFKFSFWDQEYSQIQAIAAPALILA